MPYYTTGSEKETIVLAKKFARRLKGGDIVLLQGELGSGKTTFVRGLARAFGIRERITSPTFVLMRVHQLAHRRQHTADGKMKRAVGRKLLAVRHLVHVDAYRVKSARELADVGLADWLGRPDTIVVVEWGEKIKPLLKGRDHLCIKFKYGEKLSERIILVNDQ